MKHQTKDDKILNCLVMIDAVQSLPASAFVPRLGDWKCGSAACLGGWVAQHPHFKAKGVYLTRMDGPATDSMDSFDLAPELFGDRTIFYSQAYGEQGYAKQVALDRLNKALARLLND